MTNSSSVWFVCINAIIKAIFLLFHLCPCCNYACLSACGLFSRCTAATSNSYKSHYTIASRFALRAALPVRASDWPLKLLGRPLRAGYRSNRKSRLPSRRPVIGESGSPWTVNHFLSPRASRSAQFPATRWVRCDETRCIPTDTREQDGAQLATCERSGRWTHPLTRQQIYPCRYLTIFIRSCIFWNICSLFESPTFIGLLFSALVFSGGLILLQGSKNKHLLWHYGKVKRPRLGFCLDTCRSVGLLLQTFIDWVILTQVYVNVSVKGGISRLCAHQNKPKISQYSIMGCPLLWNAFAALVLVLLSKGKFSRATLTVRMPPLHARISCLWFFRTRSWRWILMMTCRVLPARESRARAKPLRSSFPQFAHARM